MANGKPGDDPLLDIVKHGLAVFGDPCDALILEASKLCSRRELYEWWERSSLWQGAETPVVQAAAEQFLAELRKRAMDGGWELPD
ncbi:MAG: hypothetical protein R3F30_06410 [Planctomycetota bacterium]